MSRGSYGIAGFAARYPLVWHVIEAEGAGCDILYPAATLRRLSGLPADSANRGTFLRLALPNGAPAILRLQLMPDARLSPTLAGDFTGRPDLWRAHIDRHVFFWVTEDRRDRFLRACVRLRPGGITATGNSTAQLAAPGVIAPVVIAPVVIAPVVIAVDTRSLLTAHGEAAFFSRINTGSTLRGGARTRRDETTLRALSLWRGERAVELAIRGPVPLAPDAMRGGHAPPASRHMHITAYRGATSGGERTDAA
jgi:hypothetical protein